LFSLTNSSTFTVFCKPHAGLPVTATVSVIVVVLCGSILNDPHETTCVPVAFVVVLNVIPEIEDVAETKVSPVGNVSLAFTFIEETVLVFATKIEKLDVAPVTNFAPVNVSDNCIFVSA